MQEVNMILFMQLNDEIEYLRLLSVIVYVLQGKIHEY